MTAPRLIVFSPEGIVDYLFSSYSYDRKNQGKFAQIQHLVAKIKHGV
jgi:hypothetical protein